MWAVAGGATLFLALLGGIAARPGSASVTKAAWRVAFCGAFAMASATGVGALFRVAA